ncbi:hypothetical protein QEG73_00855 [Chitinophagaceae bacterium 26-R-25]|nr:hypothetical protein [Chitinophagaceae bacterium 26-R-25]
MPAATTNTCLFCQQPITKGRSDKKFCHAGCKDAYYNALKSEEQQEISNIDLVLKRNRRILKKLFRPERENLVHKEALLRAGFDFGFHTHFLVTRYKRNQYCFCYDFGYREVGPGTYKVIKRF